MQNLPKFLVIFEMDDDETSIHEHDTLDSAMEDWNDNKQFREGMKCIACVIAIEE